MQERELDSSRIGALDWALWGLYALTVACMVWSYLSPDRRALYQRNLEWWVGVLGRM